MFGTVGWKMVLLNLLYPGIATRPGAITEKMAQNVP